MKILHYFFIVALCICNSLKSQINDPLSSQESIDQMMKEKGQEVVFSGKKGGSANMKVLQLDYRLEHRNKSSIYICEYGKFGFFGPGLEIAHKYDFNEKFSLYSSIGETFLAGGEATFLTELTTTGTYYFLSRLKEKKSSISASWALGFKELAANEIFIFKYKTPATRKYGVHAGAMYNGIKCYQTNGFAVASLIANVGFDINTYYSARVVLSANTKRIFYTRKEKHQYLNLLVAAPIDTVGLSTSYGQLERSFMPIGFMYGYRCTLQKKSYEVGESIKRRAAYYAIEFGYTPGIVLSESLYNYCIFTTRVGVKL